MKVQKNILLIESPISSGGNFRNADNIFIFGKDIDIGGIEECKNLHICGDLKKLKIMIYPSKLKSCYMKEKFVIT